MLQIFFCVTLLMIIQVAIIIYQRHTIKKQSKRIKELKKINEYDTLTGLFNQGRFRQSLNNSNNKYLVFVDVNKFKSINDTYGHLMGDHALEAVAEELRQAFTHTDRLYRCGGDEFAVLVKTKKTRTELNKILSELNCNLKLKEFKLEEGKSAQILSQGVSYGYAEFTRGIDPLEVYRLADARMYAHKKL